VGDNVSREDSIYILLGCTFVGLLVVSNIIASKIIMVAGLVGPAAVICYSLTFALTDTITELWGKERTKLIVKYGFIVSIITALFIRLAIVMPAAPFWTDQEAYSLILGSNLRIVAASLIAYLISQYHDIWAFMFWKNITKGKHLWLRNNLSTGASQLLDTVVFITLAFAGMGIPLLPMIIGQYIIKIVIAFIDTPVVYLLVNLIKKNTSLQSTTGEVKVG
jgi:queuosine precursor transporter